jgi:hypothetical protein
MLSLWGESESIRKKKRRKRQGKVGRGKLSPAYKEIPCLTFLFIIIFFILFISYFSHPIGIPSLIRLFLALILI